ncbi:MAG: ferrous iron transport protein B [Desulfobacteraceae bacterium]|nr:MAG: ferrous iron transport protein B [Desulfobacteraceae bacterium]
MCFALAGNPNAGKTTIFNNLTGARQKVSNWPGVTVEKKEGIVSHKGQDIKIVDLPGTYSLTPYSIEEITARDFILQDRPDVVINIIDSANLERSLYLALQILELAQPTIFVLNMADVARNKGIKIDDRILSDLLKLPVIFTVGNKNKGVDLILDTAVEEAAAFAKGKTSRNVTYSREIEECITTLEKALLDNFEPSASSPGRWNAIKLLENDPLVKDKFTELSPKKAALLFELADTCIRRIDDLFQDDIDIILTDDRYGFIEGILKEAATTSDRKRVDVSRNIDLVLTDRFLGIPIFLFFIWAMFQATFTLGAYPMDMIDSGVMLVSNFLDQSIPPSLIKKLILDGIIAGIGSVIIFLPNILILFFCIALFEDTGYMARAAFLMDRVMHTAGLHGKSFIPMLMGFGCNVPAIIATKTLESRKDRILTILMTPFMSCSARLPVYIILAGTFFTRHAGTVIFGLYFCGILAAILTGQLLRRTLLRGEDAPFVMELPPYRIPMMKSLLIHMWDRSKMFLKKMGGVILIGAIIIWTLSNFPRDVNYSTDFDRQIQTLETRIQTPQPPENQQEKPEADLTRTLKALQRQKAQERVSQSFIGMIGKGMAPIFAPIGIDWQSSVALLSGLVAKEIVVSTLGVLHGVDNDEPEALKEALQKSGMTPLSALSMMVFVLLYIPCIATVITIWKETSKRWAIFNFLYTTTVAWCASFLVYQTGMIFTTMG